jgi:hypothetical protein
MKLLKYLSLSAYRIPINTTILENTAQDIIQESTNLKSLAAFLQWDPSLDILQSGFSPFRQARELGKKAKLNRKRQDLKRERIRNGFSKLYGPRKGIKGWIQKTWRDPKEKKLPYEAEIYEWVTAVPRYALLVSLHDALLAYCSSAEPRVMSAENVSEFADPLTVAINQYHEEKLETIQLALSTPLKSFDPGWIIDFFPGYVLSYDRTTSMAYYYGERYE